LELQPPPPADELPFHLCRPEPTEGDGDHFAGDESGEDNIGPYEQEVSPVAESCGEVKEETQE